jgi:hypothetical protein
MAEAGRVVLDGFELRTDAEIIRHPNRYADKRGVEMWDRVMGLLDQFDAERKTVTHVKRTVAPALHRSILFS